MHSFFTLLALAGLAGAATLRVPTDHATLPAAFAASAAGDLVLVEPGLYSGNLVFPAHALSVRSTQGPAQTVLSALSGSVVTFQSGQGSGTVLEGFTITGGTGTPVFLNNVQRGGVGGGVFCRNGSSPTLRGNWIHDNLAAWPAGVGGGIFAWNSSPHIQGNWIASNTAHYGGGIYLQNSNSRVVDNVVEGNSTQPAQGGFSNGKGGGLRAMWGSPVVEGNTFVDNHCHWVGSAMAFSESGTIATIDRNLLVGNQGNYPVDIAYSAHGDLSCNLLWGNTPSNTWPVAGYWSNLGGNTVADPLFCESAWPWRVEEASPCLPGQNPGGACDWIGATHASCQSVEAEETLPDRLALGPPWPNPFNPSSRVQVALPQLATVDLRLVDLRGATVRVLHNGLWEAGTHQLEIHADGLSSGLYLLVLESGAERRIRKLSLIR
jgi:hypothetical protein